MKTSNSGRKKTTDLQLWKKEALELKIEKIKLQMKDYLHFVKW